MKIGHVEISNRTPPYVIAEMSANHENSLQSTIELMRKAKKAGISAFKLQTYTADSLTVDSNRDEYIVKDGPWKGRTLFDLYKQGSMPKEWLPDIFDEAAKLNLETFSTPFGPKEVNLLETFKVKAYKVASFEINYIQLLKEIGLTKKPVIVSTGMASKAEIENALEVLRNSGSVEIALLKCTTNYPARFDQLNLSQIMLMRDDFQVPIGFSDHTESELTGGVATAFGAAILEKHIKLDSDTTSLDATFALPVSKLSTYINHAINAYESRGQGIYGPEAEEKLYLRYRRSLIAIRDLDAGTILSESDITISRPNIGLEPKFLQEVVGQKTRRKILKGEGFNWKDISN